MTTESKLKAETGLQKQSVQYSFLVLAKDFISTSSPAVSRSHFRIFKVGILILLDHGARKRNFWETPEIFTCISISCRLQSEAVSLIQIHQTNFF